MPVKEKIKRNPRLKKLAILALTPKGQARPRLWVKWFVIPFFRKKGKGATIRRRTRMDLLPFNKFYLGDYSTIEDFATINNGVGAILIGNQTRVGIGSVLIGPVHIGDNVRIAQNVVISGLNHNYEDVSLPISVQGVNVNQIYVGNEAWIGANSVILPGVFIGKHSIVAAGSVVTKNVPPNCVVGGNPARIIKEYDKSSGEWVKAG